MRLYIALLLLLTLVPARLFAEAVIYTESFSSTTYRSSANTQGFWDTNRARASLQLRSPVYHPLRNSSGNTVTSNSTNVIFMEAGDLNNDFEVDFIAFPNNDFIRVHFGSGSGNFTTGTNTTFFDLYPGVIRAGDLDGDGDTDMAVAASGNVYAMFNSGNGMSWSTNTVDSLNGFQIALGDLDNDKDLDIVLPKTNGNSCRVFYNSGNGTFSSNALSGTNLTGVMPVIADFNNDTRQDILMTYSLAAGRLYLNSGNTNPFEGVEALENTTINEIYHNIHSADFNNDAYADIVYLVTQGSNSKVFLQLNSKSSPYISHSSNSLLYSGSQGSDLQVADIDNDGDMDVVVSDLDGTSTLLFNHSDGKTVNFITVQMSNTIDQKIAGFRLKDVNKDGLVDKIAVGRTGTNCKIYFNEGSPDPFKNTGVDDITTNTFTTFEIAVGDMNKDGNLDLIQGLEGASVNKITHGSGAAKPFASASANTIHTDSLDTEGLKVGDLDNDGDLDVVASDADAVTKYYLNNGTSDSYTSGNVGTENFSTEGFDLGDVDNDGDLDIVMGMVATTGNVMFYPNSGNGMTPFDNNTVGQHIYDVSVFGGSAELVLKDLNKDGHLDLYLGLWNHVDQVFLNSGNGMTPFIMGNGLAVSTINRNTNAIALGDVNRDGNVDAVVGYNNGWVYLFINSGNTSNPFGGVGATLISNTSAGVARLMLADLNRDGHLDLVQNILSTNQEILYLGDSTSSPFVSSRAYTLNSGSGSTDSWGGEIADMNKDGSLDIVIGNHGQKDYIMNGNVSPNTFMNGAPRQNLGVESKDSTYLAVGDVDLDGDIDAIVANVSGGNSKLYQNSTSVLSPFSTTGFEFPTSDENAYVAALEDMNNDGRLDAIFATFSGNDLLFLNNGTSTPFSGVTAMEISSNTMTAARPIMGIADFNGDGWKDVIVGSMINNNQPNLYLNSGNVTAPFNGVVGNQINNVNDASVSHLHTSIAIGDVDRDGDLDVVIASEAATMYVIKNNGTANPFSDFNKTEITGGANYSMVDLGDIDRDGDLDIVGMQNTGGAGYYINNGSGTFSSVTDFSNDNELHFPQLVDIDNDGDLDVVSARWGGANSIFINEGNTPYFSSTNTWTYEASSFSSRQAVVADIDRDGLLDILTVNNGLNYLYSRTLYTPGKAKFESTEVETRTQDILKATINATQTVPTNSSIEYYLTNNNGTNWYRVHSGTSHTFATTGNQLRWRAEMFSNSTVSAPYISTLQITANSAPYVANSAGMTVNEGASLAFNSTTITISDLDQATSQVVFTMGNLTSDGNLYRSGVPLMTGNTFTLSDVNSGFVTYTHSGNENTFDSFDIDTRDGDGGFLASSSVNITITPVNDTPILGANTLMTLVENGNVEIASGNLTSTDADDTNSTLIYTIKSLPTQGNVTLDGNTLALNGTFTQGNVDSGLMQYVNHGELASDSFNMTVKDDGAAESAQFTFSVNITTTNDTPTIANNTGYSVSEGANLAIASGNLSGTDKDDTDSALIFTLKSLPSNGNVLLSGNIQTLNATFTQAEISAGNLSYTHDGHETTSDSFNFSFKDDQGAESSSTGFSITVNPNNDTPGFANQTNITLSEGSSTTIASGNLSASDVDDTDSALIFTLKAIPSYGNVLLSGNIVSLNSTFTQANVTSNLITYAHDGSETTSDNVLLSVKDDEGAESSSLNYVFTISPVNDTPSIITQNSLSLSEGGNVEIGSGNLNATDPDNTDSGLIYTLTAIPSNGNLLLSGNIMALNGTFTQGNVNANLLQYLHDNGESTSDAFTLTVKDTALATSAASNTTITITPVNDTPTFTAVAGANLNEGASVTITTSLLNVNDPDHSNSTLTYTLTSIPSNGNLLLSSNALSLSGTFTHAQVEASNLVYTHDGHETTSDSFALTIKDAAGATSAANTFAITVAPVNDTPTFTSLTGIGLLEGGNVEISSGNLNATDPDDTDSTLVYTLTSIPLNGNVLLSGNNLALNSTFTAAQVIAGSVQYRHDGHETTSDTMTLTVKDDSNATSGANSISFTITPVNDAPVVTVNQTLPVALSSNTVIFGNQFLQASDVDNADAGLTYTLLSLTSFGNVTKSGNQLGLNGTFLQSDIDAGNMAFSHNGETFHGNVNFTFSVSDNNLTTATNAFNITISDNVMPYVTSITPTAFSTIGITTSFSLLFTEAVSGANLASSYSFSGAGMGNAYVASATGTGIGPYAIATGNAFAAGNVSLNLTSTAIADARSNLLTGSNSFDFTVIDPTINLSLTGNSLDEGGPSITVTANMSHKSSANITSVLNISGNASFTQGDYFLGGNGTISATGNALSLSIPAGQTAVSFSVSANLDIRELEGIETLDITLTSGANQIVGSANNLSISIHDKTAFRLISSTNSAEANSAVMFELKHTTLPSAEFADFIWSVTPETSGAGFVGGGATTAPGTFTTPSVNVFLLTGTSAENLTVKVSDRLGQTRSQVVVVSAPVAADNGGTLTFPAEFTTQGDYRLVSLPFDYTNTTDLEAFLNPTLGEMGEFTYLIYSYLSATGLYEVLNLGNAKVGPGRGYWMAVASGQDFTFNSAGPSANQTVEVPLDTGWNMIGNPYGAAYSVDQIYVSSQSGMMSILDTRQSETDPIVWGIAADHLSYQQVNQLGVMEGAWLYVQNPKGTSIFFAPTIPAKLAKAHRAKRSKTYRQPPAPPGVSAARTTIAAPSGGGGGGCFISR